MKAFFRRSLLPSCLFLLLLMTSCQSHCRCCKALERNPITPKDCYYQDYYQSTPMTP